MPHSLEFGLRDPEADNPLAEAFATVLANPYGPPRLTAAVRTILPHLEEAQRRGVPYAHLAVVLSRVSVAAGRAPVSEDTLRSLVGRLRIRARAGDPSAVVGARRTTDPLSPPVSPMPSVPRPVSTRAGHPGGDGPAAPPGSESALSERARRVVEAKRALSAR